MKPRVCVTTWYDDAFAAMGDVCLAALARYDRIWDASPSASKISYIPFASDVPTQFVVAGIDYSPHKNVKIVPNVEMAFYGEDEAGETPEMELIPRLTFFWKF